MSFFDELKRRNVVRVGIAYLVAAWVLIQVSDVLTPIVPLPSWALRLVFVILVIGFVPALILAWAYELTPGGIRREEDVTESSETFVLSSRQKTVWAVSFSLVALLIIVLTLNAGGLRERLVFGVASGSITSIAVLPLKNLSGDPEQDYFVDGMTETLIAELSKIGALRVISRQSVMRFRGSNEPLVDIARQLNVDAVVEGSALQIGEEVRITVQLIEGATDIHLWADSYDRDISDVLKTHSEVARAIARKIRIIVTTEEAERLASVREVNPEAYRLYLLGRHFHAQWRPEPLDIAIQYYRQAIAIEPQYAEAHVGVAGSHLVKAFIGAMRPRDAHQTVQAELALALEIDSNLAETHQTYAASLFYYEWDWKQADEEFQLAVSLNPNYATAHQVYAWFLAAMDRPEEAHASITRVLDVNPLDVGAYITASDVFWFSHQYDKAIAQIRKAVNLNLTKPALHERLGWNYLQTGMFQEAIGELEIAVKAAPEHLEFRWMLGHAYAVAGRTAEARKVLDDLHGLAKKRYVPPYGFAVIHTGLGENDEAFEWLERAYQDRNAWMVFLQVVPWLDPLRSDPRFQDLLRRMNFPK
jgi:TolB-like protein/Tfp pilus assembly protein PilF